MKLYKLIQVLFLSMITTNIPASDINDTYTKGDTLTATHLDNIKSAVNDNDERIKDNANAISGINSTFGYVLKDAGGDLIGKVIGMQVMALPYVLTDNGYTTWITMRTGYVVYIDDIYGEMMGYESFDCTGDAYMRSGSMRGTVYKPVAGAYEVIYSNGLLFYTPPDEPKVNVSLNSRLQYNYSSDVYECEVLGSPSNVDAYRSYANDFSVTGIKNTKYQAPLVIE